MNSKNQNEINQNKFNQIKTEHNQEVKKFKD